MTTEFLERIEAGTGTAHDAALALEAAMSGQLADADNAPDSGNPDADNKEQPEAGTKQEGELPDGLNADNAVIASKNGQYTISYSQLEKSRQAAAQAQAEAADLRAQLEAANARQAQGTAPTQADAVAQAAATAIEQGVDPELFGDFSEEAMTKGIIQLNKTEMAKLRDALRAELFAELAPMRQERQAAQAQDHNGSIYAAHADADSIVQSNEFSDWVNSKPSFAKAAYLRVLDSKEGGTAQEVIELFDTFKKENGIAAKGADADLAAKAKTAVARATHTVPSSISDIPGGRMGATNHLDAIDSMSPAAAMAAVQALSPEQREAYMNRTA